MTNNDIRLQQLHAWANAERARMSNQRRSHTSVAVTLQPVSGDASFRRYFRLQGEGYSYIAVDAPPANENSKQFVQIAELFRGARVSTPRVFAVDYRQGFMLLEDFGDTLYLQPLLQAQASGDSDLPDKLYGDAIDALVTLQKNVPVEQLPAYNRERLHTEMALFDTWFCEGLLQLTLTDSARALIAATYQFLEDTALTQPQVAVHRDYHSRNLLVLPKDQPDLPKSPGIIDFQDAVTGAYTYDLVSLLRDCYISWDDRLVEHWMDDYFTRAQHANLFPVVSRTQFYRDFDLMGLQRNLKVLGIFSRLSIRDKKPRYLADIPLVIRYFLDVSSRYEELASFRHWFLQEVNPVAQHKLTIEN